MWLEQWRALAARIEGLVRSGDFLISAFQVHATDVSQVFHKSLLPEFKDISFALSELAQNHGNEMPPAALTALQRYQSHNWYHKIERTGFSDATHAIQILAPLAALRSEFEYLIRDTESDARSITELAFEHLRRQIVVDEEIRAKWTKAFKKHETRCEQLGAVHLLSHGIWAFKVQSKGATDLVFGDPIDSRLQVTRRTARALVLTEWKIVKDVREIDKIALAAQSQAAIYAAGLLGDLELKRTRYIVLVTREDLSPPKDKIDDMGITYHHIVIPTAPKVPSIQAQFHK
jgi:hypothetical protein